MEEQISEPEQMLQNQQDPQIKADQAISPNPIEQQAALETPVNPKPSLIPKKYFIIMTVLILLLGIAYAAVYFVLNNQLSAITHVKP